jgi:phosphatidylserine/phosphatidylglycerophosphate/cardiolipin synthase-like enzyme
MAQEIAFFINTGNVVRSQFGPTTDGNGFNRGVTITIGSPNSFSILAVCPGKLTFLRANNMYTLRLEPGIDVKIPANGFENVSAFVFEGIQDIDINFLRNMIPRISQIDPVSALVEDLGLEPTENDFKYWLVEKGYTFFELLADDVGLPIAVPSATVTFVVETTKPIRDFSGEVNVCDPASFWKGALSNNLVRSATDVALATMFIDSAPKRFVVEIRDEYNAPITKSPGMVGGQDSPHAKRLVLSIQGQPNVTGTSLIRGTHTFIAPTGTGVEVAASFGTIEQLLFWESLGLKPYEWIPGQPIRFPEPPCHLIIYVICAEDWFAQQQAVTLAGFSGLSRYTLGNDVTALIDGVDYFQDLYQEIQRISKYVSGHYFHLLAWWMDPLKTYLINGDQHSNLQWALDHLNNADPSKVRVMVYDHPFWDLMHPEGGTLDWTVILNALGAKFVRDDDGLPSAPVALGALPGSEGDHHMKIVSIENDGGKVAYCGGIDIAGNRMTDQAHREASVAANFLPDKLHDLQFKVRGPAAHELERVFRNRWANHGDATPQDIGDPPPNGGKKGDIAVQVACTIPRNQGYKFATEGDTTIYATITNAIRNARQYIYIEDQYFAHRGIAELIHDKLAELRFVVLVGPHPYGFDDLLFGGPISIDTMWGWLNLAGVGLEVLRRLAHPAIWSVFHSKSDICFEQFRQIIGGHAEAGRKFRACYLQNASGEFIYPHSKVIIVDDIFVSCGSANIDARGMGNILKSDGTRENAASTECNLMCIDTVITVGGGRKFARDLRTRLWAEHLQEPAGNLENPEQAFDRYWQPQKNRGRIRFF